MKISKKAQAAIDTVTARMETGNLSEVIRPALFHIPRAWPVRKWTRANRTLAYLQTFELDCRGYKQWQEVGRQVQKGSHAAHILGPRIIEDKNDDGEIIESKVIGFFSIPVFPRHMTRGDPVVNPDLIPRNLPALHPLTDALGLTVEYTPLPPDRLGDYRLTKSTIRLGTNNTAVFYHELAHAIHDHVEIRAFDEMADSRAEVIAEFTATVLMSHYEGVDVSGNAWDYLQNISDDPIKAINAAMDTITSVLGYIEKEVSALN